MDSKGRDARFPRQQKPAGLHGRVHGPANSRFLYHVRFPKPEEPRIEETVGGVNHSAGLGHEVIPPMREILGRTGLWAPVSARFRHPCLV